VGSTAASLPAFEKQFGVVDKSQPSGYLIPSTWLSGWTGGSCGGEFVGVLMAGLLMEAFGRRWTYLIGSIITAAGVGMQIGSSEWKLFLGGRIINAIGFGCVFMVSPVWIGENVRPELRGFFLCLMNGSIIFGQFLVTLIARGFSEMTGYWSYEGLLLIQFLFTLIIWVFWPWYPESPYWLLKKRRFDEAQHHLEKIHGRKSEELITCEINRLQQVVQFSEELLSAAKAKGPLFAQCFQGSNLKRSLIAIMAAAAQQFIGAAFVIGYATYFLSLVGVQDFFTVSAVLYVVMLVANLSAFFFIETAGRRPLLIGGMVFCTVTLLLIGAMDAVASETGIWVAVVMIYLWAISYQLSMGAVGLALGSEVATPTLRGPVQSLIGMTQALTGWIFTFVTPYMINPDAGNLGLKVGYIYMAFGIPFCIAFFFFVPETKGLTFDEVCRFPFNSEYINMLTHDSSTTCSTTKSAAAISRALSRGNGNSREARLILSFAMSMRKSNPSPLLKSFLPPRNRDDVDTISKSFLSI
jgi:sugar porter (SP) family MFS transporter